MKEQLSSQDLLTADFRHKKSVLSFANIIIVFILCLSNNLYADGVTQPILNIEEEDGSPSTYPYQLKVPNSSLTDNLDGTASLSTGASTSASYVTTQSESGLSGEFSLGSLTSGLLKHTVAGGVSTPATAVAGTDYTNIGNTIEESEISLSDNTTNDFSTTKHGFVPKGVNLGKYLKDDGTWGAPSGTGAPSDATYVVQTGNANLSAEQVITEGAAIDLTLDTVPDPDTLTIAFDSTELGTTTWGSGSGITWTFDASAGTDPTIAFGNGTIDFSALTIGSSYVYRVSGTDIAVADGGTGVSSWTQYGLLYAPTTTSLGQIGLGTTTQVLHGNASGAPSYSAVVSADITDGTITDSDIDTSTPADVMISSFGITIDGGGSAITTGQKGYISIPFNCTIMAWDIFADQSGSIVVDVWKDTYANFPPTVADTIAGSEKPTLSSAQKNQDTNLTTWTTTVTAGDTIGFNVDSATTVTRVTVIIKVKKT